MLSLKRFSKGEEWDISCSFTTTFPPLCPHLSLLGKDNWFHILLSVKEAHIMGTNSTKQKVQRQILERLSCIVSPSSNLPNDQTHLESGCPDLPPTTHWDRISGQEHRNPRPIGLSRIDVWESECPSYPFPAI